MPSMYLAPLGTEVFHSDCLAFAHVHFDLLNSLFLDIAIFHHVNPMFINVLHAFAIVHFDLLFISFHPLVSAPPVQLDTATLVTVALDTAHIDTVVLDTAPVHVD